jgi:HEAT repeat protein
MFARFACLIAFAVFVTVPAPARTSDTKATLQRVRELGKGDISALPALAEYLKDGNADIRLEAVKSIIKIGSMRSIDPLVAATHDNDSEVQMRAIDGLVNAYQPGYVTRGTVTGVITKGVRQVKAIFSSRNDLVVDSDVRVRPDVAQALSEKITGGNGMDVRANAALAAGILRANDTVPALEKAVHSKDSDLIFESLIALQKIKDPAAGPSVQFLARDLDDRVQSTALETLGDLKTLTAAEDIRSALKNARNVKIQRAALQALAMLAIPGDRALFQQYSASKDVEMQASALEGLGRIREPEDNPALETAFNEPNSDWRDHMAAAFALVSEGNVNTEVLMPLSFLVEGLGMKPRASVASAYLSELAQKEEVRAALAKMMPEMVKDQKIAALDVMASAATPDAVQVIQGYTTDRDRDIAFAASRALRIANSPRRL